MFAANGIDQEIGMVRPRIIGKLANRINEQANHKAWLACSFYSNKLFT